MNDRTTDTDTNEKLRVVADCIYDGLEPDPISFWNIVGSATSDEIKIGVLRHAVRSHVEEARLAVTGADVLTVTMLLFDRLSFEAIKQIIELDKEFKKAKKDGTFDKINDEVQRDFAAAKAKPDGFSPGSIHSTFKRG